MTKEELIDLISTDEGFENYLNSVRAEDVEMFAAHHGTVADFANGDNQQSHRITEIRAKHFAAQLRADKDGE